MRVSALCNTPPTELRTRVPTDALPDDAFNIRELRSIIECRKPGTADNTVDFLLGFPRNLWPHGDREEK